VTKQKGFDEFNVAASKLLKPRTVCPSFLSKVFEHYHCAVELNVATMQGILIGLQ